MVVSKRLCVDGVKNGASGGGRKGRVEADEAATPERRSSARLKQLKDQKGKAAASLADASEAKEDSELEGAVNTLPYVPHRKSDLISGLPRARVDEVGVGRDTVESGAGTSGAKEEIGAATSDLARVKYTLRKYTKYYLHFIQEEEKRCKKVVPVISKSKKPKKGKDTIEDESKSKSKRPDLKAITKAMLLQIRETNSILYPEKRIGDIPDNLFSCNFYVNVFSAYGSVCLMFHHLCTVCSSFFSFWVPGVTVNTWEFFSRAEMVVIGFHSHWLNGIDYMGQNYSKVYKNYTFPLAVAIVISGQYEDDLDNSEDVIYTGQGGNNLLGNKRQVKDQDLNRGNLALKNSCEHSVPVRVVRGHKCKNSYMGKVYTYDGLYEVVKYWPEQGLSGFTVYKYKLRRLNGQASLTTNQVHFARGEVPKVLADIRGLVCEDISGGKERIPMPATNLVDDPPVAPSGNLNFTKSETFIHTVCSILELTYDYGYALNSVVDTDEMPKELRCYCGAADCRKRLF
uniref:Uncharacterized protein n=1 Tax=Kalanchoe fedtschenkoi TaxID=63787 RepID=A0A7N0T7Q8_KALFE